MWTAVTSSRSLRRGARHGEVEHDAWDFLFLAQAALEHKIIFHNLQTVLVYYRCHERQTSTTQRTAIKTTSDAVRAYQLQKLGITAQADIDFFNAWKAKELQPSKDNLENLKLLFETILSSNNEQALYPPRELTKRLTYLYRKELLKSGSLLHAIQSIFIKLGN